MFNASPFTTKIVATLFIASSAAFVGLPAQAGQAQNVSVHIHKADLKTETGVKRVYYRLEQAAESACQANEGQVSLKRRIAADTCVDQMMSGFVAQINNQKMAALHSEVTQKSG